MYSSAFNKAIKIVSGAHHVALLTEQGDIYTFGNSNTATTCVQNVSETVIYSQTFCNTFMCGGLMKNIYMYI